LKAKDNEIHDLSHKIHHNKSQGSDHRSNYDKIIEKLNQENYGLVGDIDTLKGDLAALNKTNFSLENDH
jgi:hypothetical protein